jgi:hypothetical protein
VHKRLFTRRERGDPQHVQRTVDTGMPIPLARASATMLTFSGFHTRQINAP